METALEYLASLQDLSPDVKAGLEEKLVSAKADYEATIYSLERSTKSLGDKCREQGVLLEGLETRARTAEAKLAESELRENEMRVSNEKLTEQLKVLEERAQLRLSEQSDLGILLESKKDECARLRSDLKAAREELHVVQEAKLKATLAADTAATREEGLKAEVTRLRIRAEVSSKQVVDLETEIRKQREELTQTVREKSSQALKLQLDLADKIEELKITQNSVEDYKKMVADQRDKVKELLKQLHQVQENSAAMELSFKNQIEAQKKLALLYEENAKSSERRATALEERGKELDQTFEAAKAQHRDEVEDMLNQLREATALSEEKNGRLRDLERELDNARKLIDRFQKEGGGLTGDSLSKMSPSAAAAAKFLKSGWTLTQMYTQFVESEKEACRLKVENEALKGQLEQFVEEVRERAPGWDQQHQRMEEMNEVIQQQQARIQDGLKEIQELKFELMEAKTVSEKLRYDAEVHGKTMKDLRKQVATLTFEIKKHRDGRRRTSLDSSSFFEPKDDEGVTFKNVEELQAKNEELLVKLRSKEADFERLKKDGEAKMSAEMTALCAQAEKELTELREGRDRHLLHLENLRKQRDMYKEIAARATFDQNSSTSVIAPNSPMFHSPARTPMRFGSSPAAASTAVAGSPLLGGAQISNVSYEEKRDLEAKLAVAEASLAATKKEYGSFREEYKRNNALLLEENERLKVDLGKLKQDSVSRKIELENCLEKLNVAKTNMDMSKKHLQAAEENNKRLQLKVSKLEDLAEGLRTEIHSTRGRCSELESELRRVNGDLTAARLENQSLSTARQLLEKTSRDQETVIANLKALRADLESRDSAERQELRSTVANLKRQLVAAERRVEEAAAKASEEASGLREAAATARADALRRQDETVKLQEEIQRLKGQVDELENARANAPLGRLDAAGQAQSATVDVNALTSRLREAEGELAESRLRVLALQREAESHKTHAAEYKKIASGLEEAVQAANTALDAHRKDSTERWEQAAAREASAEAARQEALAENASLKDARDLLKEQLETAEVERKNEVQRLTKDLAAAETRATEAESALASSNKDLMEARLNASELSERYASESSKRQELEVAAREAKDARDAALSKVAEVEKDLERAKQAAEASLEKLEKRCKDLEAELEAEKVKTVATEANETRAKEGGSGDKIDEVYGLEDATPEQLKQLVNYMKSQRDIQTAARRTCDLEILRLQQSVASMTAELAAARTAVAAAATGSATLADDRAGDSVKMMSAAEHEAVMRKAHLAAAVEDSNRVLRIERDALDAKVKELEVKLVAVESELGPKSSKINELETKLENITVECETLRTEVKRWQERANSMIERTQKVNPQDLERLVSEKDRLGHERTRLAQLLEEKEAALSEKEKELQSKISALTKVTEERNKLASETKRLEGGSAALSATKAKAVKENETLKTQIGTLRRLARTYKTSTEELQKKCDEMATELKTVREELERTKTAASETKEVGGQAEGQSSSRNEGELKRLKEHVANLEQQLRTLETRTQKDESHKTKAKELMKTYSAERANLVEYNNLLISSLRMSGVNVPPAPPAQSGPTLSDTQLAVSLGLDQEGQSAQIEELRNEKEALARELETLKAAKASVSVSAATSVPPVSVPIASVAAAVKTLVQVQPQVQQQPQSAMLHGSNLPMASIRPLRSVIGEPGPSTSASIPGTPLTGIVLPTIAESSQQQQQQTGDADEGHDSHMSSSSIAASSLGQQGANVAMISPHFSRGSQLGQPPASTSTSSSSDQGPGPSSSSMAAKRKRESEGAGTAFGSSMAPAGEDQATAKRTRVAVGPFEMATAPAPAPTPAPASTAAEPADPDDDIYADIIEVDLFYDTGPVTRAASDFDVDSDHDDVPDEAGQDDVEDDDDDIEVVEVGGDSRERGGEDSGVAPASAASGTSTAGSGGQGMEASGSNRRIILPRPGSSSTVRYQQLAASSPATTPRAIPCEDVEEEVPIVPSAPIPVVPARTGAGADMESSVAPPASLERVFQSRPGAVVSEPAAGGSQLQAMGGHLDNTRVDLFGQGSEGNSAEDPGASGGDDAGRDQSQQGTSSRQPIVWSGEDSPHVQGSDRRPRGINTGISGRPTARRSRGSERTIQFAGHRGMGPRK